MKNEVGEVLKEIEKAWSADWATSKRPMQALQAAEELLKQFDGAQITIEVRDGLIEEVHDIPPGISVRVKDHDVECTDEDEIEKDGDEWYVESFWP